MSERTLSLAQRRLALRAHCAVQRAELAGTVEEIRGRLGSIDRTLHVVRYYAARPVLIAGGIGLLAVVGPRRLFRWVGRGLVLLTAGSRVMRLLPLSRLHL